MLFKKIYIHLKGVEKQLIIFLKKMLEGEGGGEVSLLISTGRIKSLIFNLYVPRVAKETIKKM